MENVPKKFEEYSPTELLLEWGNGEAFRVPYLELRYLCPCASCVDEKTGKRVIRKESIQSGIRPRQAKLVGRYAIQIDWQDRHDTGLYHFDRLYQICKSHGSSIQC